MLRYCRGCAIFRWKSTSSVIIHYNLTEPGPCWCLIFSYSWQHFRGIRIWVFVFNVTAVQPENSRESHVMGWVMLNPVKKCFLACGDKRRLEKTIKVKESTGRRKKASRFFGIHTKVWVQVTRLVVVSVRILSQRYHPRAVSVVVFVYIFKIKV